MPAAEEEGTVEDISAGWRGKGERSRRERGVGVGKGLKGERGAVDTGVCASSASVAAAATATETEVPRPPSGGEEPDARREQGGDEDGEVDEGLVVLVCPVKLADEEGFRVRRGEGGGPFEVVGVGRIVMV